jgi:Arc/MetJ-type ribon-helix-helix transcriptional regulator
VPIRNVLLTDHHEELIADVVASGRSQHESQVLREGLWVIERRAARDGLADQGCPVEINARLQQQINAHIVASDTFIAKHGSIADEFSTL